MKRNLFILFFAVQIGALWAQDPHFTQSYASPMFLNPAMTGAFDGRYRLGAVARTQWSSFLGTPFNSVGGMFDLRLPIGKGTQEQYIGAGLDLYSDKMGGNSYFSTNSMSLSGAYHKPLDMRGNNYLSAGLRVGFAQRSVNYEGLRFQDQFNGLDGYTYATGENLPANSVTYIDLGTGIFWSTNVEKRNQFHAGVGLYHINRPDVALFTKVEDKALAIRTSIVAGGQIELTPTIDIMPRIVISTQGGHFESNLGTNFRIGLDDYNDASLVVGGWLRPVSDIKQGLGLDAAVLMTGIQFSNMRIGASYDINVSPLSQVSKTVGAFELTFQYIGNYGGEKVMCPTF